MIYNLGLGHGESAIAVQTLFESTQSPTQGCGQQALTEAHLCACFRRVAACWMLLLDA